MIDLIQLSKNSPNTHRTNQKVTTGTTKIVYCQTGPFISISGIPVQ